MSTTAVLDRPFAAYSAVPTDLQSRRIDHAAAGSECGRDCLLQDANVVAPNAMQLIEVMNLFMKSIIYCPSAALDATLKMEATRNDNDGGDTLVEVGSGEYRFSYSWQ